MSYLTPAEIAIALWLSLPADQAKAERLANLSTQYIDDYIWYNLLNVNQEIEFDISKCVDVVFLPRAKINTISLNLNGGSIDYKKAYFNMVHLKNSISYWILNIKYNSWWGAITSDIIWLSEVVIWIAKAIEKDDKIQASPSQNIKSIKIWELSKTFDTYWIDSNGNKLPQSDMVLTWYTTYLDKFKIKFPFINSRQII